MTLLAAITHRPNGWWVIDQTCENDDLLTDVISFGFGAFW